MASNVAASMKASIIIDKKEIISSALSAYAEAQKEIAGNKIELLVDVSDDKARERLKEISKELAGKDYVIKFKNQGIEETMKSLDELFGRIKDVINLSNGININPINLDTNIHALQQEEAELKKVTDSYEKLLDLKHKIKNVNKSSYSGKHNTDWIGIYSSQEEAITNELADNKQKLHSSINLILSEDKNALSALEEEANRLKTALQSVQDMVNRISSNSSLSHLDENKGSEEWYKGYAEAYKAIDDRLAELHSQYRLTNEELEEYVTLQIKAEKIMEKMVSHNGGVQASGASSKAELKSWIEKSFARDLGLNPDDIYDGLFGNITDAMYGSGIGISLFDAEGAKRNLRELSAEVLKYKSATSVFDGAFGANEDAERLREISSVLTYIKKNMSEIESTDFSAQIKQATDNVEYFSKKLAEGEHTDFYSEALEKAQKELQELIELQERLNVAKRQDTDVIQTPASNAVEQLEKQEQQALATAQAEEKLAETEKNLGKSASTVDDSKFDELKADVTEIREELNGVKEKISAIDSEGFEHVKADVEKTVESVKELNSELTEVKSKLDSTSTSPVETNISSSIKDTFQGDVKASSESSIPAIKDEAKAMEQVAENAEKASKGKNEFAKANKKVKESADSSSKALNEEQNEFNKVISKLDGYQKKRNSFEVKPTDGHRYPIYQKNINELNEYIDKLQTLSQKDINLIKKEDVSEAQALQKEIDELIFKMSKMSASEKGFDPLGADKALEKINSELKKNPAMSKEAKRQIQAFYDEIRSGNPSRPIKDILDEMYKLIQLEREAGREGKRFIDILSDKALYGQAAQLAGYYLSLTDFIRYAQNGIQTIRELDTALTEMRKVSDESVDSLKKFQKASFDLADSIGTTALEVQNSTADFMRLGYTLEEASKLSQDANIYANVGDMNIDEATEHMISSIQAWRSEFESTTQASTEIIDRYNKIGNEFAITSADIGSAMERTSAALKAGGNTLNESIGLITAGNLIQQDADTTANALKVMSLRIRGSKVELESMGETTDDLADSTSKLREQIKALTGVDIMLDDNTFKSTARIIQEIGAEWSKLTDISQSATLELLAGKTRASTVAGLIENYETINKVITAAENAEGSALAENEKYLESIEGKIASLKNELQSLAYDLIDSGTIKDIIDAGKNIISIINKTTDGVSLLSLAIGGLSSYGLSNLNLD